MLIFGSSCANVWPKLKPWKPFYLIFFVCRCKIRINGLFGKNSRLRCFVANFIADGFTRFLCYFLGAKSVLVLIFTLLECLKIIIIPIHIPINRLILVH